MILVDSPIWSLALRRREADLNSTERKHVRELARLIETNDASLIGAIRQEVLSGVRDARTWERLRDVLRPFTDVALTAEDYERAAHFSNRCRAVGISGGSVDMLICSAAAKLEAPIYTIDADFKRYAPVLGLTLHSPLS